MPDPKAAWRGTTVRVMIPESPELRAWLDDQRGEWSAETGAQADVVSVSIRDLVAPGGMIPGSALATRGEPAGDILVSPSSEMSNVVAAGFATRIGSEVLESAACEHRDFATAVSQHLMAWNRQPHAFPISAEPRLLFYRADLLRDPGHRQAFEDQFGRPLRPPSTWDEFDDVVRFFTGKDLDGDGSPDAGVELSSAGEAVLCRAAAYGKTPQNFSFYFDVNTMDPLAAGPAFQESIEKWHELSRGIVVMADGAPSHFAAGRAAMALASSRMAAPWLKENSNQPAAPRSRAIECTALPGSRRVYQYDNQSWVELPADQLNRTTVMSGLVGSVTKDSSNAAAAYDLLVFLTSRERSMNYVSAPTYGLGPYRMSHLVDVAPWVIAGWSVDATPSYLAAVRQSLSNPNTVALLRIDGSQAYHDALERGALPAWTTDESTSVSLDAVSRSWQSITESQGTDRQRRNYRYSLGMPVLR